MASITVTDLRSSGLREYNYDMLITCEFKVKGRVFYTSLTSTGTITSTPLGQPTRHPDSSKLWISFRLISYFSKVSSYPSNHSSTSFSSCAVILICVIGFVLIFRRGCFLPHFVNQFSEGGGFLSCLRSWQIAPKTTSLVGFWLC